MKKKRYVWILWKKFILNLSFSEMEGAQVSRRCFFFFFYLAASSRIWLRFAIFAHILCCPLRTFQCCCSLAIFFCSTSCARVQVSGALNILMRVCSENFLENFHGQCLLFQLYNRVHGFTYLVRPIALSIRSKLLCQQFSLHCASTKLGAYSVSSISA